MEKLQPLITHRFWVLFGLAILVPFIVWFIYNGSIQETIQGRRTKIESEFSTAKAGGSSPNKKWSEGAAELNKYEEAQYTEAASMLWLEQQNDTAMFWPRRMEGYVYPAGGAPLAFGEGPADNRKSLEGKTIYQTDYDEQFQQKVLSQISRYKDGEGLCEVNEPMIHRVPSEVMKASLPEWEAIWHAQEDVWLVAQLLKSIDNVNTSAGARSITEAPVRQIHELQLYGGNLDNPAKGSKKAGGGYGGMSSSGRSLSMGGQGGSGMVGMDGMAPGGSSSGNRGSEGIASPDIDFDVIEEFGSPEDTSKKKGKERSGGTGMQGYAAKSKSGPYGGPGGMAGGRRYVQNKDDGKFKTRGFKTKLTIQQDKLPTLLAELTNSRWPVEIVRVHWEAANENGRQAVAVSSGSSGGGLGGGSNPYGSNPYSQGNNRSLSGPGGGGSFGLDGGPAGPGGSGGGLGGGGLGGFGGQSTKPESKDPLSASLRDPNLATVVIAGLITIFKVSDEEATKIKEKLKQESATDVGPGTEPATDTTETPSASDDQSATDGTQDTAAADSATQPASSGAVETPAGAGQQ